MTTRLPPYETTMDIHQGTLLPQSAEPGTPFFRAARDCCYYSVHWLSQPGLNKGFPGIRHHCLRVALPVAIACQLLYRFSHNVRETSKTNRVLQGITFEKVRRATDRSLKMTIWSLGSDLCYEEKISARGRHYNTIHQDAPFYQLSVRAPPF